MNREDLQEISRLRVREARVLLQNGYYSGAYYLIGYAVECALKACIAKQVRRYDFPDRNLVRDSYTHDLEKLLGVSGLREGLDSESAGNPTLQRYWTIVKDWSEQSRYNSEISENAARDLYSAVSARKKWSPIMVDELVVKESLTNEMIDAGAELISRLDAAGFDLNAALWLYMEEPNAWRLILASLIVKKEGPNKAYKKIQSVMSKRPEERKVISLAQISAVRPDKPIVALLRKAVKTGNGISGVRFSRNAVDGQFIEDSYIYRMT